MELNLRNKVVLITGGSKGIGLACAQAFLREGARVAIVSRSRDNLQAASRHLPGCFPWAADLADASAAESAVAAVENQFGPVDVLVNSAGSGKRTPPAEVDASAWRAAMDAKFFPYIHAIDAVLPSMVSRKTGAIVNIIGTAGKVAIPTNLPGGAACAALMLASAGLANAWASHGIRVNAINPGATVTERLTSSLASESRRTGKTESELLRAQEARLPVGRYARPEEIADAVLFLASERASYINGALLTIDGGLTPLVV